MINKIDYTNAKRELDKQGWAFFEDVHINDDQLLQFAELFGRPISTRNKDNLVDVLMPLDKTQANPKSMSAIYGISHFPFHTDLAYLKIPGRYILLYAFEIYGDVQETLIADSVDILNYGLSVDALTNNLFYVSSGIKSFLTTVLDKKNENIIFRFDQHCMIPCCKSSKNTLNQLVKSFDHISIKTINWKKYDLAIIDNWRCLHSRGAQKSTLVTKRVLKRISII